MAPGVEFKRGYDGEHCVFFALKVSGGEHFRTRCERMGKRHLQQKPGALRLRQRVKAERGI